MIFRKKFKMNYSNKVGLPKPVGLLRASRFGLTGLLLFQKPPFDYARWDRLVPTRILLWALPVDGEARTWAPTELIQHSTLRHSDAWHAAYGGLATVHHAYALAQFASFSIMF